MQMYLDTVSDSLPADFREFLHATGAKPSTLSEQAMRVLATE